MTVDLGELLALALGMIVAWLVCSVVGALVMWHDVRIDEREKP